MPNGETQVLLEEHIKHDEAMHKVLDKRMAELAQDVRNMRDEVVNIRLQMAKWGGIAVALIALGELAIIYLK